MTHATEFHYIQYGLLVSWAQTCGHLSNPMFYDTTEKAEEQRARMESMPCWECRNNATLAAMAKEP